MPYTRAMYALTFFLGLSLSSGARAGDRVVLGAIGDSISTGFNTRHLGPNRNLSWSTGNKAAVDSHKKKLEALFGHEIPAFNEAVAGAVATGLDRQIDKILKRQPDYLTITIGANDVCSWKEDHEPALAAFESELRKQLGRVISARPDIKVFLAPIPDMYNLWEIAVERSGCQARWNLFNICSPLLSGDASEADRQAFVARWRDANLALERVADVYADNVFHNRDLANVKFDWEHVSDLDCFHPSVAGQNLISEEAWNSGWGDVVAAGN